MRASAWPFHPVLAARFQSGLGEWLGLGLIAAILASFLVSPALLHALGVRYASPAGSLFEKLHLATMLVGLVAGLSVLCSGRLRFTLLSAREFGAMLGLILLAVAPALLLRRPVTGLLVTFLTPVLLIYLLQLADDDLRRRIRALVAGLLLLNSCVGLIEFLLQATLLPRIAGAVEIDSDGRALGLVGHPLSAAFLSGLMLVYLVISRMMTRFDRWSAVQIGLHAAALLAFGGRLALVASLLMLAIYVLFDGTALIRRAPVERWLIRYGLGLAGIAGAMAVLVSGLAGQVLARFTADGGSAATRWAAIEIARSLDREGWLMGLSPLVRAERQQSFGTPYGIEMTWLAWLIDHGLVVALGLALLLALVLRVSLRGGARVHFYMTAYFLIVITGAQGLGAKSLLLTWLVIVLLTFRRRNRSPERNAPS